MNFETEKENRELTFDEKIEIYENFNCEDLHNKTSTKQIPLLTEEEELELATRVAQGDPNSEGHLFIANVRFANKIADIMYELGGMHHKLSREDYIQEGHTGLIYAIRKFDYQKGYRFTTYASYWIKQNINRSIENSGRTIRLPTYFWTRLGVFKKNLDLLTLELEEKPKLENVAQKMGITKEQAVDLDNKLNEKVISINKPFSNEDGEFNWEESLPDPNSLTPEIEVINDLYNEDLQKLIQTLSDKEQYILNSHFGLNGEEEKTLSAIGREIGLTRERVRQIANKTFEKMKNKIVQQDSEVVKQILESFPEEEKKLFGLKYGLNGGTCMSTERLSRMTGISTRNIAEVENKVIKEIIEFHFQEIA